MLHGIIYVLNLFPVSADTSPMGAAKNLKVRSAEKIKVLLADDDWQSGRRAMDYLNQNGFDCRMVHSGIEAKKMLLAWQPKVLIVDLLLPEANAFELLRFCQNEAVLREKNVAVLVMSGHNSEENVRESYQRGARDYLARPIRYPDLLSRVVFHCRDNRSVTEIKGEATTDSLKIADLVITQALEKLPFEEILHNITQMATLKVKGMRCSIVFQMTHEKGIVLASNDKKDIAGLALDLRKYPEIQLVVNTGKMIVIDNLDESRALSRIKNEFKNISFNGMILCPLYYQQKIFGVISMRMPSDTNRIADRDVHFLEYVAKVLSLYLGSQSAETIGKYGLIGVTRPA